MGKRGGRGALGAGGRKYTLKLEGAMPLQRGKKSRILKKDRGEAYLSNM